MKICYKLMSSRVRESLPKNALAGVACALLLLLTRPSHAGTIVVNSAADTVAYDGVCTLREAVISANADVDYADCTGASGFDTLIVNATPVLSTNEPIEISSGIMLQGGNYPLLRPIIGKYSQFVVDQTATLELSDIKLTQFTTTAITVNSGWSSPSQTSYQRGYLLVQHSEISGNDGGDVGNQTPSILSLGGNVTITASILQNNVGGIKGAAVLNQNGSLDINGSSFISNVVDQYGGAIHNYGGGYAYIYNSTFGGNQQTGQTPGLGGGAIYNSSGSTVDIDFCTITQNSSVVSGGGIRNEGMMSIKRSIISGNSTSNSSAQDCGGAGTITSGGYNLVGTCPNLHLLSTDRSGQPQLLGLSPGDGYAGQRFYSPTATGPETNVIPSNICSDTWEDQRGNSRPSHGACEIGAIETL